MDIRFPLYSVASLWALTFLLMVGISAEHLFTPATPSWDIAADMLLQNRIRDEGWLLTGHYSRWQFNHPGPFWFYYNQVIEWVLAPIGMSRIQTWHWGSVLLNSVLVVFTSVALTCLLKPYRYRLFAFIATAMITAFIGSELTGIWMPERMIAPYAAFLVSLPLLAAGNPRWLPVSVLLVCILVHGYVTMPVMTLPFLTLAVWRAWQTLGGWQGVRQHAGILLGSVAIIVLFVAPLVLDYLLAEQPNIEKILAAQISFKHHDRPDASDLATFTGQLLFRDHLWQWVLVVPLLLLAWHQSARLWRQSGFKQLLLLLLATTLLVFVYYSRTPAPLFAFVAKFYLAVPPLLVLAILSRHRAIALRNKRSLSLIQSMSAGVLLLMLLPALKMEPIDQGSDVLEAAEYLSSQSSQTPLALNYTDHYQWPHIAGILLELDRRGLEACTTWRHMAFLYTPAQVCAPGTMPAFTLMAPEECKDDCQFTADRFAIRAFQSSPVLPGMKLSHMAPQFFFHNWQVPEQGFRWSKGRSASLVFHAPAAEFTGQLHLSVQPLGRQKVELSLNDIPIFSGTIEGSTQAIMIDFDPALLRAEGTNTLEFRLPDARAPDGPDTRILALALHSLTLN